MKSFTIAELTPPGRSAAVLLDPKDSAMANPDRTILPGAGIRHNPGGKGPARDALTWTRHEGLRECFAEYARHPLPTFIKAFNS